MNAQSTYWQCRHRRLEWTARPLIMGVVNVTPDSFSDGGQCLDPAAAIRRGCDLVAEGVDLLDIGGESTRPGAAPVAAEVEEARVVPVIRGLRERTGIALSIDTRKAGVAAAALAAGADIVNDVSALTHDPAMVDVARKSGAGVVLMHLRGEPGTMQDHPVYDDVVAEVRAYLDGRLTALRTAGLDPDCIVLDPGLGFGKTFEHNRRLLDGLPALAALGRPVLVGLSRKRMIGRLTGRAPAERLAGSLAGLVFAILRGAHIVRVHDGAASLDAARVAVGLMREEREA
jgi:dihydropteroate synthase